MNGNALLWWACTGWILYIRIKSPIRPRASSSGNKAGCAVTRNETVSSCMEGTKGHRQSCVDHMWEREGTRSRNLLERLHGMGRPGSLCPCSYCTAQLHHCQHGFTTEAFGWVFISSLTEKECWVCVGLWASLENSVRLGWAWGPSGQSSRHWGKKAELWEERPSGPPASQSTLGCLQEGMQAGKLNSLPALPWPSFLWTWITKIK